MSFSNAQDLITSLYFISLINKAFHFSCGMKILSGLPAKTDTIHQIWLESPYKMSIATVVYYDSK